MKTRSWNFAGVAIATLLAATTLTSVASNASIPSSPAERAATAELNRRITLSNAAADERARAQEAQYQAQMRQYEAEQQQYQAALRSQQDSPNR